jgi:hypothetical protein
MQLQSKRTERKTCGRYVYESSGICYDSYHRDQSILPLEPWISENMKKKIEKEKAEREKNNGKVVIKIQTEKKRPLPWQILKEFCPLWFLQLKLHLKRRYTFNSKKDLNLWDKGSYSRFDRDFSKHIKMLKTIDLITPEEFRLINGESIESVSMQAAKHIMAVLYAKFSEEYCNLFPNSFKGKEGCGIFILNEEELNQLLTILENHRNDKEGRSAYYYNPWRDLISDLRVFTDTLDQNNRKN